MSNILINLARRSVFNSLSRVLAIQSLNHDVAEIEFFFRRGKCTSSIGSANFRLTVRASAFVGLCGCIAEAAIEIRQDGLRRNNIHNPQVFRRINSPGDAELGLMKEFFLRDTFQKRINFRFAYGGWPIVYVDHWRTDFEAVKAHSDDDFISGALFDDASSSVLHWWNDLVNVSEDALLYLKESHSAFDLRVLNRTITATRFDQS